MKNDWLSLTVIFNGLQFEHGMRMNVFDTPILNDNLEVNRKASNMSEFPFPDVL